MKKPVLYQLEFCPGVRAVRLVANVIGVKLELRSVNLLKNEQMEESYLRMNPQHTVPTLDDDGLFIWDSHAISQYLIEKYGNDETIIPNDPYIRARINQRLHFDTGVLFAKLYAVITSIFKGGATEVSQILIDGIEYAYGILETFLATDRYLVGNHLTLADLSCITTVTSMDQMVSIDKFKYPRVTDWIQRLSSEIPDYDDLNSKLAKKHGDVLRQLMLKNQQ